MLTRERLIKWMRARYGWRHLDRRINDLGYAYSIDTHPDAFHDGDRSAMTIGNGPILVIKRTGGVWGTGSNPLFGPLWQARTEEEFNQAMATVMPANDPARPPERVPLVLPIRIWRLFSSTTPWPQT